MSRTNSSQKDDGGAEAEPLLVDGAAADEESIKAAEVPHTSDEKRVQRAYTWLKRHLMFVLISILLVGGVIALAVYFALLRNTSDPESEPEKPSICLTPPCVQAAYSILDNMSPNSQHIDPCENFDQYVCEGFNNKHDLRPDQGGLSTASVMAEESERLLRHLLESPYEPEYRASSLDVDADRAIFDKLKDGYVACMDEKRLKEVGSKPLLQVLVKIAELYPQIEDDRSGDSLNVGDGAEQLPLAMEDANDITRTVTYLTKLGVNNLILLSIGADDKDPDVVVPSIYAPFSPGLPTKEYYEDPKLVKKYGAVIGEVLEALLKEAHELYPAVHSLSESLTFNAELVDQILQVETALANATPKMEDALEVTFYYNPRSLAEIAGLVPQLSFGKLISALAPSAPAPSKIIVESPEYLKTLATVFDTTDRVTLQAYFVWKTVQAYHNAIDDDAVKPLKEFNNELAGKDPEATEERWRTCVKASDWSLGWILSKFFVDKAFSQEAKDFGDKIVSDIKNQFVEKLKVAKWMSKDVRDLGIQKVHAIVQKIGFPTKSPNILDSSELQAYYADEPINSTTHFANVVSAAKSSTARSFSALGKPTNRDEWEMTADTVNAYYNPPGNEIVFPAGIMQAPVFYNPNYVPPYISYGAFGAVSGHELSHAFDSTGRHYDETGNYTDWWDPHTVEAFKEKAQCFVDQYAEYTVPDPASSDDGRIHVNGKLTLGENIADAGGLNAAFKAWKQEEGKKSSQLLPGLQKFSKEQLFFMSYATFWCGKTRPEVAKDLIFRDPHAPAFVRTLGATANSRDFREAFNCPVKKPTCELW